MSESDGLSESDESDGWIRRIGQIRRTDRTDGKKPHAITSYCSRFCDFADHPKVPTLEPNFPVGSCVHAVPGVPRISQFRMVIGVIFRFL